MVEPKRLVRNTQIPCAESPHQLRWHPKPIELASDAVRVLRCDVVNNINPRIELRSEARKVGCEWLDDVRQHVEPRGRITVSVALGGVKRPCVMCGLMPATVVALSLCPALADSGRLYAKGRRDGRRAVGVLASASDTSATQKPLTEAPEESPAQRQ